MFPPVLFSRLVDDRFVRQGLFATSGTVVVLGGPFTGLGLASVPRRVRTGRKRPSQAGPARPRRLSGGDLRHVSRRLRSAEVRGFGYATTLRVVCFGSATRGGG